MSNLCDGAARAQSRWRTSILEAVDSPGTMARRRSPNRYGKTYATPLDGGSR